jgi:hypothetical protein
MFSGGINDCDSRVDVKRSNEFSIAIYDNHLIKEIFFRLKKRGRCQLNNENMALMETKFIEI